MAVVRPLVSENGRLRELRIDDAVPSGFILSEIEPESREVLWIDPAAEGPTPMGALRYFDPVVDGWVLITGGARISDTEPTDGDVLEWDETSLRYVPTKYLRKQDLDGGNF